MIEIDLFSIVVGGAGIVFVGHIVGFIIACTFSNRG